MTKTLEHYGFDDWFSDQAKAGGIDHSQVARVIAVDREQYLLLNNSGTFRAKLSGKFRHESHSHDVLPSVGDWLEVEKHASDEFGLIQTVLPRKTFLRRKMVGQSSDYQMIAANIDIVFVVLSCHYDFNLKRLERYLIMVAEGGAKPVILLTKTDLVEPDALHERINQIRLAGISDPVLPLSNITSEGLRELREQLIPGKTYCFTGSSGVGKSTLINNLMGDKVLATRNVSASGEGTHTTVRRELIMLDNGAMVIDNPGMREFGVIATDEVIDAGFSDINQLAEECQFRDCTHTNEPGCAVINALEQGLISHEHYENYFKLRNEAAFNQMSQLEKRKKDKGFGRMVKNVKKQKYKK